MRKLIEWKNTVYLGWKKKSLKLFENDKNLTDSKNCGKVKWNDKLNKGDDKIYGAEMARKKTDARKKLMEMKRLIEHWENCRNSTN